MRFHTADRGQAIQVGAVLLLGIAVIALSLAQTTVVPAENKKVEFKHNLAVQNDLVSLRNALLKAGTTESVQPVSIDMGTTYPSRIVLINPPPPGGLLRNGSAERIAVRNAMATDSETDDFLNTTRNGPYRFTTKNISYRPGYNVYQSAPTTTYQTGIIVNEFNSANDTVISGQTIVQGKNIYLVAIKGNIAQAQVRSLSVDPRSLSTSIQSTTIRSNNSNKDITITIPTTLSANRWKTLLGEEYDQDCNPNDSSYVCGVSNATGREAVQLTFENNTTYRLRTALVGVGVGGKPPKPAYLTRVTPNGGADIAVEVRDKYNNPVPNSRIDGTLRVNVTNGKNRLNPDTAVVGEDGRASFTYAGNTGPVNLTLVKGGNSVLDAQNGSVNFKVTEADLSDSTVDDGGVGGNLNPNETGGVILEGADIVGKDSGQGEGEGEGGDVTEEVRVTLRYLNDSGSRNISKARFNFYSIDSTSNNKRSPPKSAKLDNKVLKAANSGGQFRNVSIEIKTTSTEFSTKFYKDKSGTTEFNVEAGDFFVFSVIFENGDTATYFVAPTS